MMKKYLLLPIATCSLALMTGCSTFWGHSGTTKDQTTGQSATSGSAQTSSVQQSSSTATAGHGSTSDQGSTSGSSNVNAPSAKITLEKKKNKIIAYAVTNWGDAKQGDLLISWVPPKQTKCYSTSLVVKKYDQKNDKTWASRTYHSSKYDCSGVWKAKVVSKKYGTLSTAEMQVK